MRIEYRDLQRRKVGRIDVDPAQRPTRAAIIERGLPQPEREAFLSWEGALDDAGQLRACVACGCGDLFREKAFPQVTGLVIVLAFVGAIVGALGLATNLPVLLLLILVLVLDIAILLFSTRRLVCYRCRSSYHDLPIARYHRPWDRTVAERYPVTRDAVAADNRTASAPPHADADGSANGELPPAESLPSSSEELLEKNYFA